MTPGGKPKAANPLARLVPCMIRTHARRVRLRSMQLPHAVKIDVTASKIPHTAWLGYQKTVDNTADPAGLIRTLTLKPPATDMKAAS